jgi:hypothetical protein
MKELISEEDLEIDYTIKEVIEDLLDEFERIQYMVNTKLAIN